LRSRGVKWWFLWRIKPNDHQRSRSGTAGVKPCSISRVASLPGIRRQRPSLTLPIIRLAAQARTVTGFIRSRSAKSLTVISSLSSRINFDGCTLVSQGVILPPRISINAYGTTPTVMRKSDGCNDEFATETSKYPSFDGYRLESPSKESKTQPALHSETAPHVASRLHGDRECGTLKPVRASCALGTSFDFAGYP
jgi:hypothetical protein